MDIFVGTLMMALLCVIAYQLFKPRPKGISLAYLGGYPGVKGLKAAVIQDIGDAVLFLSITLLKKDITMVKLVSQSQASSALGGAILGALVAGPIGALAGAAATSGPGNVIQVTAQVDGLDYEIFFTDNDVINKYSVLKQMIGR